jgi:uncharacterized protein (TIGR02453 family)
MAALDFYEDLGNNNTKAFWDEHKAVYKESVEAPMKALVAALEPEFGKAKIFRPNRDVRFSKDKSPYKDHMGAYVASANSPAGWYVQVSASGVMVGGGFYEAMPPQLAVVRAAIADDATGAALEAMIDRYRAEGWDINSEGLKTVPRGYAKDHPRIELLRLKWIGIGRDYRHEGIDTPELLDRIRADWEGVRPLVRWFDALDIPPVDMRRPGM